MKITIYVGHIEFTGASDHISRVGTDEAAMRRKLMEDAFNHTEDNTRPYDDAPEFYTERNITSVEDIRALTDAQIADLYDAMWDEITVPYITLDTHTIDIDEPEPAETQVSDLKPGDKLSDGRVVRWLIWPAQPGTRDLVPASGGALITFTNSTQIGVTSDTTFRVVARNQSTD